ncbi:MAG: putative colanic acid biosynthesis acetyltransferase [Candidatus Competibacteraceae bacterium]|nr:MAG: putative colanic acid biosynthesis acetyltransferase [Candidatus Competibacteraceae bacterium]
MGFEKFKYQNNLSFYSKFRRLLWSLSWVIFFLPTPDCCFHGWRRLLLICFGAKIGKGFRIASTCKIWAPWNLAVGDYVCLAENVDCYTVSKIEIGSKVTVSQRTFLCTASHDITSLIRPLTHLPITIGNHAWVCAEAFIGPGVTVGEGAVVGVRAVVTKRDVRLFRRSGSQTAGLTDRFAGS